MNQDVRIGYACLNPDISQGFKTCRFDNLTNDKWIELIEWNLATLEEMIMRFFGSDGKAANQNLSLVCKQTRRLPTFTICEGRSVRSGVACMRDGGW